MPSSPAPLVYSDSCVFLAYVNEEAGRVEEIEAVLAEADKGEWEIVTSTYTVAEVAFAGAEKDTRALDPAVLAKIDKLWLPNSPVKLVEFHVGIAERARTLMRQGLEKGRRRLKPGDAIHLATAQDMGVSELHTYNTDDFAQWSTDIGAAISNPAPNHPTLNL